SSTLIISVRSLASSFTSIIPRVWLRKTRNRGSSVRSTDDGWMKDSSNGSMTMRPLASSSRIVWSERITAGRPGPAGRCSGLAGAGGDPAVLLVRRLGGYPEGVADVGPGGALLAGLGHQLGDERLGGVAEPLRGLEALVHVAPGESLDGVAHGRVGRQVDLDVAPPDPGGDGALSALFHATTLCQRVGCGGDARNRPFR